MESRNGSLFCHACQDLVYDHDLERLRATALGLSSAAGWLVKIYSFVTESSLT